MAEHRPQVVFLSAARVAGISANDAFPADFITDNLAIQSSVITSSHAVGVDRLLQFIADEFPSPAERTQITVVGKLYSSETGVGGRYMGGDGYTAATGLADATESLGGGDAGTARWRRSAAASRPSRPRPRRPPRARARPWRACCSLPIPRSVRRGRPRHWHWHDDWHGPAW